MHLSQRCTGKSSLGLMTMTVRSAQAGQGVQTFVGNNALIWGLLAPQPLSPVLPIVLGRAQSHPEEWLTKGRLGRRVSNNNPG